MDDLRDAMLMLYAEYRRIKGFPPLSQKAARDGLKHDAEAVTTFNRWLRDTVLPAVWETERADQ